MSTETPLCDSDPKEVETSSETSTSAGEGTPITAKTKVNLADSSNVFVGNLPSSFTNDDLRSHFQEFGEIVSVKVMLDLVTGVSRRFGFVLFREEQGAKAAIAAMNQKSLGDPPSTLRVTPAALTEEGVETEGDRLYIRNLPAFATKKSLEDIYNQYGSLIECSIMRDNTTGQCKGVGFARFGKLEDARRARFETDGQTLLEDSVPLIVRFAFANTQSQLRRLHRTNSNASTGSNDRSATSSEGGSIRPSVIPLSQFAQQFAQPNVMQGGPQVVVMQGGPGMVPGVMGQPGMMAPQQFQPMMQPQGFMPQGFVPTLAGPAIQGMSQPVMPTPQSLPVPPTFPAAGDLQISSGGQSLPVATVCNLLGQFGGVVQVQEHPTGTAVRMADPSRHTFVALSLTQRPVSLPPFTAVVEAKIYQ